MKRKFKLIIEYEGTRYHGWQVQSNGVTVQEVLQKALQKITKKKTSVVASGRTDAGVHAEAQTAHFTTSSRMTPHQFLKALNSVLPHDITVRQVEEVPLEFHAQKSALRKTYRYTLLNRDYPSALAYRRCWFVPHPLNVNAMRRAKTCLLGRHDFSAFRASNCEAKSPVKELTQLRISREKDFIHLLFEGNAFLKHMIRNITGTLVDVGKGRMAPGRVKEILDSRDRNQAGPTAPPQGLCLLRVDYPDKKKKTAPASRTVRKKAQK